MVHKDSVTETVSQTWECFAGAHEQTELIGWIELNQDNNTIEDKAIPCKATDNRMLRGRTGNKRQSLATLASTACTNKVMNQAGCLPLGVNMDLYLGTHAHICTHSREQEYKAQHGWEGAVRSASGRHKELSLYIWVWGRRRKGLFPSLFGATVRNETILWLAGLQAQRGDRQLGVAGSLWKQQRM